MLDLKLSLSRCQEALARACGMSCWAAMIAAEPRAQHFAMPVALYPTRDDESTPLFYPGLVDALAGLALAVPAIRGETDTLNVVLHSESGIAVEPFAVLEDQWDLAPGPRLTRAPVLWPDDSESDTQVPALLAGTLSLQDLLRHSKDDCIDGVLVLGRRVFTRIRFGQLFFRVEHLDEHGELDRQVQNPRREIKAAAMVQSWDHGDATVFVDMDSRRERVWFDCSVLSADERQRLGEFLGPLGLPLLRADAPGGTHR